MLTMVDESVKPPIDHPTTEYGQELKVMRPSFSIMFRIKKWNGRKAQRWIFILALLLSAFGLVQFELMRATRLSMVATDAVDYLTMTIPWFGGRSRLSDAPDRNSTRTETTAKHNDEKDKVQQPLNIVILYPDDWRHDSLEDAQPSLIHTPFLSQLAREGIRFTHNAVTSSICWMSRATLFSGRYASQHRSLRLACPYFTDFENWKHSWPYMLMKQRDYWVGHIGKWQFRNNEYFLRNNSFHWTRLHEGSHWYNLPNTTLIHAADRAQEDAIAFLRERPTDQPFALTVAFYPPKPVGSGSKPGAQWSPKDNFYELYKDHQFVQPYNFSEAFAVLPPFLKRGLSKRRFDLRYRTHYHYQEGMKRYHALVSQVDRASEQIVEELKRQNVYDKTLIIVTADNGMMLGAHGLAGKWHAYEESIRVPLLIRDPRMSPSKHGTTDDSYTLNIDLAPTILGAAGIQPSPRMQGRDMSDLYLSTNPTTKPWRQDFYYEMPLNDFPESSALITKKWKYIRWSSQDNYEQLFDLQNDPYELHDVLAEQGANSNATTSILQKLRARYQVLRDLAVPTNDTGRQTCQKREYGAVLEST